MYRIAVLALVACRASAADPGATCVAAEKLANGACKVDADCVLTDAPLACNACNLADLYPVPKATLAARDARCGGARCTVGCPPADTYTPAFYRAECRNHRCIAWRWHSGG